MSVAEKKKKAVLSPGEIKDELSRLRTWTLRGDDTIVREFTFGDFREAMSFTNQVAGLADRHDHHPDISISYNKVKLELSTHSEGGLTERDFTLAREIDGLDAGA